MITAGTASACSRRIAKVSSSAARVWITTGRPSARRQLELRLERAPLVVARRVVAVVVEPGLADRARRADARAARSISSSRRVVEAGRLVRMAADDREHLVVVLGGARARAAIASPFVPTVAIRSTPAAPRALDQLGRRAARSGRGGSGCRSPARPQAAGRLGLDPREELAELADVRAAAGRAERRAVEAQVLAAERGQQPLGRVRA